MYVDLFDTEVLKAYLMAAREVLAKSEAWTQEVLARNSAGTPVPPDSKDAVCFCAMGAMDKVVGDNMYFHYMTSLINRIVNEDYPGLRLGQFNDTHTHAEVLAVFDKAINSL